MSIKELKLTSAERSGRSQLVPGVLRTYGATDGGGSRERSWRVAGH
jgi:hypothetical protein